MTTTHDHPTDDDVDTGADPTTAQGVPRRALVEAALIPVMVLTGFAMLAIVPLGLLVRTTVRDPRLRGVRPWLVVLVATYATPLLLWAILPDRAPSLTKDMHPAFVPVITVAGVLVLGSLARTWFARRGSAAPHTDPS